MISPRMCAAFYKAEYGGWFSKIIAGWTNSLHSHTETVFSRVATLDYLEMLNQTSPQELEELIFDSEPLGSSARLSFSASERDGGVRFKLIGYEDKWDSIPFVDILGNYISRETEADMITWCSKFVGRGYDYVGLLGFLIQKLPLIKQNPKKFWCSETTEMVAHKLSMLDRAPEPPSPGALYDRMTAAGAVRMTQ